jgi:hypothetical protein
VTERARFTRRQEALTIGWLRSLPRSAKSTSTADIPPTVQLEKERGSALGAGAVVRLADGLGLRGAALP